MDLKPVVNMTGGRIAPAGKLLAMPRTPRENEAAEFTRTGRHVGKEVTLRLLVVEDQEKLAKLVCDRLELGGFLVDCAREIGDALARAEMTPYALVVLDRRLPDGDAITAIPRLRRLQPGLRILMLTALDAVDDRVLGLESGADDYLTKPFAMDELLARVKASLRRPAGEAEPPLSCGQLVFDAAKREASVRGQAIILQRRELALLAALIPRAGRVVMRETLSELLYGLDDDIQSNALDVQVSRLRRRLLELGSGVAIITVRGVGYMMKPE
jgi:DNA-binding response OmpR family regulator